MARRSARSGGCPTAPGGVLAGVLLWGALFCLAAPGASAQSRTVTFVNQSSGTVREIYIDDATGKVVGGNRLRSTLPPNARAAITYSQGCRANVRVVLDDRTVREYRDTDVCTQAYFVVTGTGGTFVARTSGGRGTPAAAGAAPGTTGVEPPPELGPWTGRSITKRLTLDGYK